VNPQDNRIGHEAAALANGAYPRKLSSRHPMIRPDAQPRVNPLRRKFGHNAKVPIPDNTYALNVLKVD
jgi:hypothetical protein